MTALRWICLGILAYGFLAFELGRWVARRQGDSRAELLRAKAARVARRLA